MKIHCVNGILFNNSKSGNIKQYKTPSFCDVCYKILIVYCKAVFEIQHYILDYTKIRTERSADRSYIIVTLEQSEALLKTTNREA